MILLVVHIGVKHSIIFIIECTWESINLHECVDFRLFRVTTHYFIGEIYLFLKCLCFYIIKVYTLFNLIFIHECVYYK